MDENYIAYESLMLTRQATNWAFWSMIGTCASAVITFFAVFVAYKAMHAWKFQDARNDRRALKAALVSYRNTLAFLPDRMIYGHPDYADYTFELMKAMAPIHSLVTVMEEDDFESEIGNRYVTLNSSHSDFIKGLKSKQEHADVLIPFISYRFVK
ncbi:hypothetical protein [Rahnella bonaserana]|uniref:hypothetical protein n=1 Tax=Rahnella bonaserana TaxID=2816248 RepID=UPI00320A36C2